MEHSDYTYQSLDDLDAVKNRKDRSVLTICSMHPERFLSADVAHPNEVKHLTIILGFENDEEFYYSRSVDKQLDKSWFYKYTDSLCSDIINFHNLETLVAEDLKLSTDLWIKFANNSKHLKEIRFSGTYNHGEICDDFEFDKKEEALDALFKIPTLEKVYMNLIDLPYFPPGPSNIKQLELDHVVCEDCRMSESYLKTPENEINSKNIKAIYRQNLPTHTNIKSLVLRYSKATPYGLKDLKLDQMFELEELILYCWEIDIEPILLLPKLKKFKYYTWIDKDDPLMKKLIKDPNLRFPSIEEMTLHLFNNPHFDFDYDDIKKYLADVLKKQCVNIKKFVFNNEKFREQVNF